MSRDKKCDNPPTGKMYLKCIYKINMTIVVRRAQQQLSIRFTPGFFFFYTIENKQKKHDHPLKHVGGSRPPPPRTWWNHKGEPCRIHRRVKLYTIEKRSCDSVGGRGVCTCVFRNNYKLEKRGKASAHSGRIRTENIVMRLCIYMEIR